MRIFLTGAGGMLARAIAEVFAPRHVIIGVPHEQADISGFQTIARAVKSARPDAVVNAAAFTDVDACETKQEHAFLVNATAPGNLARICNDLNIPLMHFSTDYVFDGEKKSPYTEEDAPNPLSVYGRSKLQGEKEVRETWERSWIVRVCGVFGPYRKNFVSLVVDMARKHEPLRIVREQTLTPTYTLDAARGIEGILLQGSFGVYHLTNQGCVSRLDFTREILRQVGMPDAEVIPIASSDVNRPASRPANSCLENARLKREGLPLLPEWRGALARYVAQLNS